MLFGILDALPPRRDRGNVVFRVVFAAILLTAPSVAFAAPASADPGGPAIVGSGCQRGSSPSTDPDGAQVFCAQLQYTDAMIWSRVVDTRPCGSSTCTFVPVGSTPGGYFLGADLSPVGICVSQTGWTASACQSEIAASTYRGDAPARICMGESIYCNPSRS